MKGLTLTALLLFASTANAALIRFDISGQNARSQGAPPRFTDNVPYDIDIVCEEDISSCTLTFNIPEAPPQVSLPTVEVVWNDLMHSTNTRGFTSSDFQTQMRLLGPEAELAQLSVNNFNQAVTAVEWRYYDDDVWPNFSGYYGAVATDISTPITIPEPSFASMAWLPLTLGFGSIRSFARRRKARHL